MKPPIEDQKSLGSFHNEHINSQPVIELTVETSQSLSPNISLMTSNMESFSAQGQTTPDKKRSKSKCSGSHRGVIPRVRLNKNENTPVNKSYVRVINY